MLQLGPTTLLPQWIQDLSRGQRVALVLIAALLGIVIVIPGLMIAEVHLLGLNNCGPAVRSGICTPEGQSLSLLFMIVVTMPPAILAARFLGRVARYQQTASNATRAVGRGLSAGTSERRLSFGRYLMRGRIEAVGLRTVTINSKLLGLIDPAILRADRIVEGRWVEVVYAKLPFISKRLALAIRDDMAVYAVGGTGRSILAILYTGCLVCFFWLGQRRYLVWVIVCCMLVCLEFLYLGFMRAARKQLEYRARSEAREVFK